MLERLADKRILVIGASSGIGRAVAIGAAAADAKVAVSARRAEKLAELDALPVVGDVADDGDCERVVEEAAAELGGLDGLVYTVGASPLRALRDATGDDWRRVFATNVIGAALVLTRAAPHLLEANGRAIVLSSKAVSNPFPDLTLYTTSKFALDGLLASLRAEFPALRLTRVEVGNTLGTEFAAAWDPETLAAASERWAASGVLGTGGLMHVDQVAEAILFALASSAHLPDLAVIDHETDDGTPPG